MAGGGAARVHFDSAQAARIAGLPAPRLRQCVRAGLLHPERDGRGRLRFDFVDLVLLRTTKELLRRGIPLGRVRRVLQSLRRQIGSRPLTRLSVFADGRRVVAWDGATQWQPESGQFLFNFDVGQLERRARRVARLPEPPPPRRLPALSADEWCDLGLELEDGSPLEARAAYHHALDLDPGQVTARINLGRLLHAEGNLVGAEAHYREAVRRDPASGLAWYNLGVLFEDRERPDDALAAYEQAVRSEPALADAHYNLALLYDRAGRRRDAVRHLAHFRRLTRRDR